MAEGDAAGEETAGEGAGPAAGFGRGFLYGLWYFVELSSAVKRGGMSRYEIMGEPVLLGRRRRQAPVIANEPMQQVETRGE